MTRAKATESDAMSTPEKRKRTVEWDEANLAKNFAERSATMKIDEIETPWHSPPRELFHDLSVEDEGRAPREDVAERERRHAEVMAKLHEVIRADVRGRRDGGGGAGGEDGAATDDAPSTARGEKEASEGSGVAFHDPDARDEDFGNDAEQVVKRRLFEAKRKAFQAKGRSTKRYEEEEDE